MSGKEATPRYEIDPGHSAMIIVDPQLAFGEVIPVPNAGKAVENMRRAVKEWRKVGKVIVTRHIVKSETDVGRLGDFVPHAHEVLNPKSEASFLYKDLYEENDILVDKNRFNAFIGTDLGKILKNHDVELVIISGLTTPVCVEGTVRGAHERDFKVIVLKDACASQSLNRSPQKSHEESIAEMGALFAETINTEDFIERLNKL